MFTAHKAQGQMIEHVMVDISPTKRFSVDTFAVYLALSQSTRVRTSIRLLRDFDDSIFTKHPSEYLQAGDTRLAELSEETKARFEAGSFSY
jgi:hypothetical protein